MRKALLFTAVAVLSLLVPVRAGDMARIGYSCSNFKDGFQMQVLKAAKDEAGKHGFKMLVDDAREDVQMQADQIENMISEGATALLVVPVDTSKVDHIVAAAKKAEIPLVFVNRNPFPGERPPDNCFVIATDARVEGESQMNFAGKIIGSNGHVVILQGILANEATQSRTSGVQEVIAQSYPELAITAQATANWQRDQAKTLMAEWLKAYGREKIDAVLANNDEMALGALDALEERGIADVTIVGVDAIPAALQAIKDGKMAGTVLQDPELQGRGGVNIAARALRGESQAQNFILPSELITKDEVDKYLKN